MDKDTAAAGSNYKGMHSQAKDNVQNDPNSFEEDDAGYKEICRIRKTMTSKARPRSIPLPTLVNNTGIMSSATSESPTQSISASDCGSLGSKMDGGQAAVAVSANVDVSSATNTDKFLNSTKERLAERDRWLAQMKFYLYDSLSQLQIEQTILEQMLSEQNQQGLSGPLSQVMSNSTRLSPNSVPGTPDESLGLPKLPSAAQGSYWRNDEQAIFRFSLDSLQRDILQHSVDICIYVLISPKRIVPRFGELAAKEVQDLFATVHRVSKVIEAYYQATSLTIAIQDGPDAGQSVPHVHVHVLPRKPGDFANNDEIYDKINSWNRLDNEARKPRGLEEMAEEASKLRPLFATDD